jgi:ABC-type nickel/cobalt efflux system permease component RcnA
MEQELMARFAGLFLIVELLVLALNPIPETAKKWKAKKCNMLRRLCYLLALIIAAIWIATL